MSFQPEPSTAKPATLSEKVKPATVAAKDVESSPLDKISAQNQANYKAQLQKIDSMPKIPAAPSLSTKAELPSNAWSTATNPAPKK